MPLVILIAAELLPLPEQPREPTICYHVPLSLLLLLPRQKEVPYT